MAPTAPDATGATSDPTGASLVFSVNHDINKLTERLTHVQKSQIPFATAHALNHTAFELQKVLREDAKKGLKNPTPFTEKAWMVRKAGKRNLFAEVYTANNRGDYWPRLVRGGAETPKKLSLVEPVADSAKNKYGNIPRGKVKRMIANEKKYFSGTPKGRRGRRYAGVWERTQSNKKLQMIVHYHKGAKQRPVYYPYSRIERLATLVIRRNFRQQFPKSMEYALKTAK